MKSDYCLNCRVIRGRQEGICPGGDGFHDWASKSDPEIEVPTEARLREALEQIAGQDHRWPGGYQYPRELAEAALKR